MHHCHSLQYTMQVTWYVGIQPASMTSCSHWLMLHAPADHLHMLSLFIIQQLQQDGMFRSINSSTEMCQWRIHSTHKSMLCLFILWYWNVLISYKTVWRPQITFNCLHLTNTETSEKSTSRELQMYITNDATNTTLSSLQSHVCVPCLNALIHTQSHAHTCKQGWIW